MATTLDQLVVQLQADISGLRSQLGTATSQINTFVSNANRAGTQFKASTVAMGVAFNVAAAAIVAGAVAASRSVIDTGMQMQALQNKMTASIGSSYAAADALRFISDQSQRLGLDFQASANGFANFAASALRSGMTLDQTQKVFVSVAEAATALHLSADQTSSAFLALEQMASKGTVQMQELKLQLAQAIPGAFEIMAKAMGVSTQQLNQLMQKGEVLAADVLPKLGAELHAEFGERAVQASTSAQAAVNRFHNSVTMLNADLANRGVLDAYTGAVDQLTSALNNPQTHENLAILAKDVATLTTYLIAGTAALANYAAGLLKMGSSAIETAGNSAFRLLFGQAGADAISAARLKAGQGGVAGGGSDSGSGNLAMTGSGLFADLMGNNVTKGQSGGLGAGGGATKGDASRLESVKEELASETEALQLEYNKRQQILEEALKKGELTKQQYRELSFQNELKYKNAYGELYTQQEQERLQQEQEVSDAINAIRKGTLEQGIGLLQSLGQKNKAFAIAAIALEKAKGIAEVLIASKVAAAKALAIYGPTPAGFAAAAEAATFGYIQAGLIAATGLAEAATSLGGGGSNGDSGTSDFSDGVATTTNGVAAATNSTVSKVINLTVRGNSWTASQVRDLVNSLNEFIDDGTVKINGMAAA